MVDSEQTLDYFERKNKGLFKKLKFKLKQWLGWLRVPLVIPYRGFGSFDTEKVYITGALVEDQGLEKPDKKHSFWENAIAMLKRYTGDYIANAKIRVDFKNQHEHLTTTENGLYKTSFAISSPLKGVKGSRWIKYTATLTDKIDSSKKEYSGTGEILIPGSDAEFGVISDIDDTIIVSHSTQTLRKLRLMLMRNSRTRKPFPGVEEFYRALEKGSNGKSCNPFFYISSSEWNLYDLLDDFCSFNQFPKGVFLLRELKPGFFNVWKQGGGDHEHKFRKIIRIFDTYPNLSFVLVGDNGQHDPIIYSRVAEKYPNRIKAIYIRTVKKQKDSAMKRAIADMEKINVRMIFTPDTINAAQHAESERLIAKGTVKDVIKNSLTN